MKTMSKFVPDASHRPDEEDDDEEEAPDAVDEDRVVASEVNALLIAE